jgi:hypothetical protein
VVHRLAQRVNRADHLFLWGMQKAALGIGKSGCAGGGQGPAGHGGQGWWSLSPRVRWPLAMAAQAVVPWLIREPPGRRCLSSGSEWGKSPMPQGDTCPPHGLYSTVLGPPVGTFLKPGVSIDWPRHLPAKRRGPLLSPLCLAARTSSASSASPAPSLLCRHLAAPSPDCCSWAFSSAAP